MSEITRSYGALCAFGVTYMSSDPGPPWNERQFEPVFQGPRENVYRLRGALGRAYTVPEVVTLGSDVQVISAMMAPGFHPARVAFASVPGAEGVYPGSIGCRIEWLADEPDRVALEVPPSDTSRRYLKTKKEKLGHILRSV